MKKEDFLQAIEEENVEVTFTLHIGACEYRISHQFSPEDRDVETSITRMDDSVLTIEELADLLGVEFEELDSWIENFAQNFASGKII